MMLGQNLSGLWIKSLCMCCIGIVQLRYFTQRFSLRLVNTSYRQAKQIKNILISSFKNVGYHYATKCWLLMDIQLHNQTKTQLTSVPHNTITAHKLIMYTCSIKCSTLHCKFTMYSVCIIYIFLVFH